MGNNIRYTAIIQVEAKTPLFIGSGETSLLKDAVVQKDWNGMPMIPGTALAGVLRHSIEDVLEKEINNPDQWDKIFGFEAEDSKEGQGSRLKLSSAQMMISEYKVSEGVGQEIAKYIKEKFDNLPKRQHVKINEKGTALDNGLFDNEVVYAGTRFVFEMELAGTINDASNWQTLIDKIKSPEFRLGSGTRNGYGNLKVIYIQEKIYNLINDHEFDDYLYRAVSINDSSINFLKSKHSQDHASYTLRLNPEDFFIFSTGYADEVADNLPIEELVIEYKDNDLVFCNKTLIPASSIKGAIAHRTAFHYNKLAGNWAEDLVPLSAETRKEKIKEWTSSNNEAVYQLFGAEMGHKKHEGSRGHVIIDDVYYGKDDVTNDKIFNHVAIDRFTGGALEGALFSEKVSTSHLADGEFEINIYLDKEFDRDSPAIQAFENALLDITKGLLPLGGMTTKGHGFFTGSLVDKNNELISTYHKNIS